MNLATLAFPNLLFFFFPNPRLTRFQKARSPQVRFALLSSSSRNIPFFLILLFFLLLKVLLFLLLETFLSSVLRFLQWLVLLSCSLVD